jgi:hypothetical protein
MRFVHQKSCCALSMLFGNPLNGIYITCCCQRNLPKGKVIELTDVGKLWGENVFVIYRILSLTTSNIKLLSSCDSIISKLSLCNLQHQVCVYRTKEQYDRSHELLSEMLVLEMCTKTLSPECINAIQQFQIVIKEKECYLAFYVCSKTSMSFDAMTTSPVESMNSSLKRGTGINKNSNTRYVNG